MKPLAGGAIEDAEVAIRFISQNPYVDVVIPGMAEEEEIRINLSAINDNSPLTPEENAKINEIRASLGTNFCRRCNYCAPCAVGINIPSVLLFEGYYNRYDLKEWAKARYATLPVKASECIECGVCESRCPYNLKIRELLKEAVKVLEN